MIKKEKTISDNILLLILGIMGFISAADNYSVSLLLPAIESSFGISIAKASIIITGYMIPYGAMQPFYGYFSDRFSKRNLLKIIVAGMSLGILGTACAPSFAFLFVCRIITGFFAAGIITIAIAFIGEKIEPARKQIFVGKLVGIVFLGQGIGACIGGIFTNYINWRATYIFFFAIAALSIFLVYMLPDSNTIKTKNNIFREMKFVLTSSIGRRIFPTGLITGILFIGFYGFLGSYLKKILGLDFIRGGFIVMFYGLSCLLAGVNVGRIRKIVGKPGMIIFGAVLGAVSIALLTFFPVWQVGIVSIILLGFGYISIQTTIATLAFDISSQTKGLSSGLIGLCLFGGGSAGTAIGSSILADTDFRGLWLSFLIGSVLFAAVLIFINAMKKIRKQV